MIKKKHMRILFFLYLLILIRVIVFKYPLKMMQDVVSSWQSDIFWEGLPEANFQLFKTIKMYIRHWDNRGINSFGNLIGNIIAFIPLGYMIPRVFKGAENVLVCMLFALFFVLGIELFQLLTAFGIFDVDDILLNCLGALIGYLFFKIIKLFMDKKRLTK